MSTKRRTQSDVFRDDAAQLVAATARRLREQNRTQAWYAAGCPPWRQYPVKFTPMERDDNAGMFRPTEVPASSILYATHRFVSGYTIVTGDREP